MKRFILSIVLGLASFACMARTVKTSTIVCNPGTIVSVPLTVDDLRDVGAASFTLSYDSTAVACLGIDAGAAVSESNFMAFDSGSGAIIISASAFTSDSGEVARMRFFAREGTQGLYSDVTITDVDLGAKDGLTDLSVANPLTTINGMVRIVASSAEVTRLENAFSVAPQTQLKALVFKEGDGIIADADGEPIIVSGVVSALDAIPVGTPLGGWQTGTYALLSTPTSGLTFTLEGTPDAKLRSETTDGMTTYYADVAVEGSVEIVGDDGTLPAATRAQVKELLATELAAYPEVKSVTVKGDAALIPVVADLGIAPHLDVLGTTATASYTKPSLKIIAFEPKTGLVRIKVEPGEGNSIRAPLATGCLHAYGTSDLSQKMRFISGTSFDLTPYLQDATKGEADLTVALGSYTFIKIKAEIAIKQEGDEE